MNRKTAVIVGAGKGMGNHVAEIFGAHGFRLVLMARNQSRLDAYVAEFAEKGIEAHGLVTDAGDTEGLTESFNQVLSAFGHVDVLVYNACLLEGGKATEVSAEESLRHYRVDVAGALHSVHQVVPSMKKHRKGTIIFTGGGFAIHPSPEFACISIHKAALRALAFTLHQELKKDNIFAGTVTIAGHIAPDTHFDPAVIAKHYWQLYCERDKVEILYD